MTGKQIALGALAAYLGVGAYFYMIQRLKAAELKKICESQRAKAALPPKAIVPGLPPPPTPSPSTCDRPVPLWIIPLWPIQFVPMPFSK